MVGREERSSWSDLQPELMEMILQKLVVMDYLRCRQVCRSWRSAFNDALRRKCPPAPQLPPFLLFLPPPGRNKDPATLFDLTNHTLYTLPTQTWQLPLFDNVVSAAEGWLVFQKHYAYSYTVLQFINPVSCQNYQLHPLALFSGRHYKCHTVTAISTTVAVSPPSSTHFLVAVCSSVHRRNQPVTQKLSFCKVNGRDKSWNLIQTDESQSTVFDSLAILDCKLYAMVAGVTDSITVFNLRDPNAVTAERLVLLNPNPILTAPDLEVRDGLHYYTDNESCVLATDHVRGEVLLVLFRKDQVWDPTIRTKYFHWVKGFRVFKLDFSGPKWVQLHSLGGRCLLLDCTGIRVISTPEDINNNGLIGDSCVLFGVRSTLNPFVKRDIGLFSLKDNRIRRFPLNSSFKMISAPCLWFTPSPW